MPEKKEEVKVEEKVEVKEAQVVSVATQTEPAIQLSDGNVLDLYQSLAYIINKVDLINSKF